MHLTDSIPDAIGASMQKRILKTVGSKSQQITQVKLNLKPKSPMHQNLYPDFKCDHCGSRYVVNPMRRGNKISSSKYRAAPRHKIDPESQKILTLCNACGMIYNIEILK